MHGNGMQTERAMTQEDGRTVGSSPWGVELEEEYKCYK